MIGGTNSSRSFGKSRIIIALVFIGFSLISYLSSKEYNPVTGEEQYISLTPKQEIALGLQAAPQMIKQYGGLYPDQKYQDLVDKIGNSLVTNSKASETVYQFDFVRLMQGAIQGISFVGMGLIWKHKGDVEGLTTASTLFALMIIGFCIGLNLYTIGLVSALLILFILEMKYIKRR